MKKLLIFTLLLSGVVLADNVASNISGAQRWPWNGKVDINYTLTATTTNNIAPVFSVKFFCADPAGNRFELTTLSGDGKDGNIQGAGQKKTTWDATADLGTNVYAAGYKIGVYAEDVTDTAPYLVLDLTTYQMAASIVGPDVSSNAPSKYAELWLRRIEPGTFVMGSARTESGRSYNESEHTVTLTKAYYIGVFELTEGQYARIFSDGTSTSVLPKDMLSYNALRGTSEGAKWPVPHDHRVDATSFFGKLREKTGNDFIFDLPTEAQWEAASRWKGTTGHGTDDYHGSSVWNNGVTFDSNYSGLGDVAWYGDNSGNAKHEVGLKAPSTSGTYDMHGNVVEWCLDWYADDITSYVSDPDGPLFGSSRSDRGGCYPNPPKECRIALRYATTPSIGGTAYGCRVALIFE